jgi:cobalt/nickel transport system permease protein
MHHEYVDKYSRRKSVVHSINPTVKVIFVFAFLLAISISSDIRIVFGILVADLVLMLLSRVPILFFAKKMLFCLPFLIFMFFLPFEQAILLFSKAITSIFSVLLLMSTTKFSKLLEVLKSMRVPCLFILMLAFFYRYVFLFIDTVHSMKKARDSRCFGKRQTTSVKTASNMVGCLVVRSFDQSERVYNAMISRGYNDKD